VYSKIEYRLNRC